MRLEWRADKGATGTVGLRGGRGAAAVDFGDVAGGSGGIPGTGAKPAKAMDNPLGQWNYLEVRLTGGKARVWLNGTAVADDVELKRAKSVPESVPIWLTGHGGIRFRNVRVKELKG